MSPRSNTPWPALSVALIVAGGLGFGLARFTGRPASPPPATEAAQAPTDTVVVEAAHLATMNIAVEPVGVSSFTAGVEATGSLVAAPGGEALVTAQAAGAVVRLNKRLGDPVRAGEALAQVSSREAASMAADRTVADARAALARSVLARERSLFDQKVTARQDLEKAQAELVAADAEARRARSAAATAHVAGDGRSVSVVSPISGSVTAAPAALGAFVQPDTELFRVADARLVQVEAAVSAADAGRIRPGDGARVTTSTGAVLTAAVRSITPTLSGDSRSATVVLTLPSGSGATPGDAVRVRISPSASGPSAIVIPEEAVQTVNGREVVFVRTATGFRAQPVGVSGRSGGRAAIASGLASGQSVATRNAFLLKAEMTKGAGE